MKYKILLTCYDFDKKEPYFDEVIGVYNSKIEAENVMFNCVLDELQCLNGIMEDDTFPERRFIAATESEDFDIVVHAWDGPDYRPVTCYKIMEVDGLVEFFNAKLRNAYGQEITVQIDAYEEDDGSVWFYYTSSRYGDSDAFHTAIQAYDAAGLYLSYVGELW